ncbi:MAG: hypothetical protein NTZ82_06075 [Bacteroidetes bacterium]|nr:hypothetical protein [Bacteroidota bacterium]
MQLLTNPIKSRFYRILLLSSICLTQNCLFAQDTTKGLLDFNKNKILKKVNSLLDTNQKKINNFLFKNLDKVKKKLDSNIQKFVPLEEEQPLPYEKLLNKKYTLGRRAYQNTVSQYNYIFHAEQDLLGFIEDARLNLQEDYTTLLPFYDYDLNSTAKRDIDSIIYRCNANIVLHDLRSNWVDDSYLLLSKAYLFHKNFDTAGSLLQYINYAFDAKENGLDIPIGSNLRNTNGKFSIATKENNRFYENRNIRNESMLWQARNYFETNSLNEGLSLLQLLKSDAFFPKRLYPFLNEQLSYGYYQSEIYDSAANYLIKALPNAPDKMAKTRWYYLIAQLWEKSNNDKNAYTWYEKANKESITPLISVYAKINLIKIDFKQNQTPWFELAQSLERMSKKERYKPFTDIIYFEMAKLAIQNKALDKANDWLLVSIKKNENGLVQKQKAFELLAAINYNASQYDVSKLAYDSLNIILKTNPDFDKITDRKKWLPQIQINDKIIQQQDTLQWIYKLDSNLQVAQFEKWQKNEKKKAEHLQILFIDETIQKQNSNNIASSNIANNTGFGNNTFNSNPFGTNSYSNNNGNNTISQNRKEGSDFYFENSNSVELGKQNFIQKWGSRPNVDQWRRKTSNAIIYKTSNSNELNQTRYQQDSTKVIGSITDNSKTANSVSSTQLITNDESLKQSKIELNKKAFENAQIFLLQLNDFEKALPLYNRVINLNIDSVITERSLLDIASQYIHEGHKASADSVIKLVQLQFPNGIYSTNKSSVENKKAKDKGVEENYKEAYFLAQIGNWKNLSNLTPLLDQQLRKTKWFAAYQFLKVKMYAQQRMDSTALILLDSIIYLHQNERIRDRAKNIIEEIKNRKETELYLTKLNPDSLKTTAEQINLSSNTSKDLLMKNTPKTISPTLDSTQKAAIEDGLFFTKDDTESHYVALVTNNIKEIMVKEVVNAMSYLNKDEFSKQKLDVTYLEFEENVFTVWIGPFENLNSSISYLNKIKNRLSTEILSFIPTKQYELYILGKSNIVQIKNRDHLQKYKAYMFKNIYK